MTYTSDSGALASISSAAGATVFLVAAGIELQTGTQLTIPAWAPLFVGGIGLLAASVAFGLMGDHAA